MVFYDEHGGFFDHAPPPDAPGEPLEKLKKLGFRVPGLVVGPLARRGETVHTLFNHASVPRLISEVFGLEQLNDRARLAGDLTDALDLGLIHTGRRPAAPKLPAVDVSLERIERAMSQPCSQPELLAYARARGRAQRAEPSAMARDVSRWLARAEALGAIRVR